MFLMRIRGESVEKDIGMLDAADSVADSITSLASDMIDVLECAGGDTEVAHKAWVRGLLVAAARLYCEDDEVIDGAAFIDEANASLHFVNGLIKEPEGNA